MEKVGSMLHESEFHAPLHKQLITFQKFNIPIYIDISISLYALGRLKWILDIWD